MGEKLLSQVQKKGFYVDNEVEDELNFQISQPGIFRRGPDFGFTVLTYSRLFYDKGATEYGVLLSANDIKVKFNL